MPALKRKPIIVHLGNVDGGVEKTRKNAQRHPRFKFVGIDLKQKKPELPNWRQIKADFKKGLSGLKDNSVSIISSEMAFGYYGKTGAPMFGITKYNKEVMELAFRKLKKGGKLIVTTFGQETGHYADVAKAFAESGFQQEKISVRPLTEIEYQRTGWTRWAKEKKIPLCCIVAEK